VLKNANFPDCNKNKKYLNRWKEEIKQVENDSQETVYIKGILKTGSLKISQE